MLSLCLLFSIFYQKYLHNKICINYTIFLLLLILFSGCSFDKKTGIWSGSDKEKRRLTELEKEQNKIIDTVNIYSSENIFYNKKKISAFALENIPRITRAQDKDVLSSQSNLSGYKAVLDAAHEYSKSFPMMMTAAGTVTPAKVLVLGAGVAGLQAIATAKRLGAVVSAYDVRLAAKEEVESLGAKFIVFDEKVYF